MPRPPSSSPARLAVVALAGLALLAAGCASTRELPATVLPAAAALTGPLAGQSLAVAGLAADGARVSGAHHEGLAQVRQPWIWGLSEAQKAALHGNARQIALLAFLDELKRRGLRVRLEGAAGNAGGLALSGRLAAIEINTYGRGLSGTFEGFGSAGNYWEAHLRFEGLEVRDAQGNPLWRGDLTGYAKRPDSPAKLEYTHWDLLANSLRFSLAGSDPRKLYDAVQGSKADYELVVPGDPRRKGGPGENPVELAARLAARDLVAALQTLPRFAPR